MPTKNNKTKARRTAKAVGSRPLVRLRSFYEPKSNPHGLAFRVKEVKDGLVFAESSGGQTGVTLPVADFLATHACCDSA